MFLEATEIAPLGCVTTEHKQLQNLVHSALPVRKLPGFLRRLWCFDL